MHLTTSKHHHQAAQGREGISGGRSYTQRISTAAEGPAPRMKAQLKSAKCAYCKSWGVDVPASFRKTASWLKCEIPSPICDMPVREWLFDEEAKSTSGCKLGTWTRAPGVASV